MMTHDKKDGWFFTSKDSGKEYGLFEMMSYKGNSTSDMIAIWDLEKDCFVNHVYGANCTGMEELFHVVSAYVEAYETQVSKKPEKEAVVNYEFSRAGATAFLKCASDDFFEEMEKDYEQQNLDQFDIVLSCGKHSICVPLGAEEWGCIEGLLEECMEIYEW